MIRSGNCPVACEAAEIVHALENQQPAHPGLREHITIESRQRVRAKAVGEQVVAADTLVQHPDGFVFSFASKPLGKDVRPAVISVCRGAVAVRDGIAEGDNRSGFLLRRDIHRRDLIPVIDRFGIREIGPRDLIAVNEVRGCARSRVSGFLCRRRVIVNGDGQIGAGWRGEIHGV